MRVQGECADTQRVGASVMLADKGHPLVPRAVVPH